MPLSLLPISAMCLQPSTVSGKRVVFGDDGSAMHPLQALVQDKVGPWVHISH